MRKRMYARRYILLLLCLLSFGLNGCSFMKSKAAEAEMMQMIDSTMEATDLPSDHSNLETQTREIYVYICGQVCNEGVYQMSENSRVFQLIDKAGGLTKKADISSLNQAEKLEDGEKIYIPKKGESNNNDQVVSEESVSESGKININTASKEELMTLNGIGASRAESILQYRQEHGRFQHIEELKNVSGIGKGIYSKIEGNIYVR